MSIQIKVVSPERHPRCGFCETGRHERCSIGLFQAGPPEKHPYGAIILCLCDKGGCKLGRIKCRDCGLREGPFKKKKLGNHEIDSTNWKCFDRAACQARIETKRAANPLLAELRDAREKADMAKATATKTTSTKAKTPKVGKCLVTGKPTKGGLFLPGMDARYCSERVADVMEKRATEKQAVQKMKDDGTSETLQAKFVKNLGIAREKQAKKDAAAKDKADAKKEKEKASAAK